MNNELMGYVTLGLFLATYAIQQCRINHAKKQTEILQGTYREVIENLERRVERKHDIHCFNYDCVFNKCQSGEAGCSRQMICIGPDNKCSEFHKSNSPLREDFKAEVAE